MNVDAACQHSRKGPVGTEERGTVEKRYYTVDSLDAEVRAFEERYGMASEAVVIACAADRVPPGVSYFDAAVWVDAYEEAARLRGATRAPAQLA